MWSLQNRPFPAEGIEWEERNLDDRACFGTSTESIEDKLALLAWPSRTADAALDLLLDCSL